MIYGIAGAVFGGMLIGFLWLSPGDRAGLDMIVTAALSFMVFCVGMDIGGNKEAVFRLKTLGLRVLLVPLAIICGTLLGAGAGSLALGMPLNEGLAVGAGLGWYSLSGVLIGQLYSVELGTVAFLTNVMRELLSFFLIPLLVGLVGRIAAIAPGGATTMDSTLPVITRATDADTGLIAFLSGLTITFVIPFLIPLCLG